MPCAVLYGVTACVVLGCGAKTGLVDTTDAEAPPARDAGAADAVVVEEDAALPRGGCGIGTGEVAVLFEREGLQPTELTLSGDDVYFGARTRGDDDAPPTGAIYRMPKSGGEAEVVPTEHAYFSGQLAVNARHLVFHRAEVTGGGGTWSASYPDLVIRELSTGAEVALPDGDRWAGVSAFAIDEASRVFFVRRQDDPRTLWVHDAPRGETTLLRTGDDVRQLMVHGRRLVWHSYASGGNGLSVAPIADDGAALGDVTTLIASTTSAACCALLGVLDDTVHYYTESVRSIARIPITGGSPTVIAEDVHILYGVAMSQRHFFWGDLRAQATLMYVATTGGTPDPLVRGDTEYIERVVTDGECVCWTAVNPPRILVRPTPP